jgi:hypothetical protein
MSSDISRQRFDPANDFNSVLMQQGRVQLDADWNEWNEILDRRWRSETIDIIGRCVVPRETQDGFAIAISGTDLTIGPGRIYVDGLQAENHGAGALEFDPILAESRGLDPVFYKDQDLSKQQPYYPNPPEAPTDGGPHLVYIDVWEREVTYVEDPNLVENAVGVDTTSRLQTVWQVRVLPDVGTDVTCSTPDDQVPGWLDIIQSSAGRLTTQAVGVPTTSDPCLIPPSGGYRGLENRTYRVEIHDGGAVGTATFKWSRDNASIASGVSAIVNDLMLTVDRIAWDSARRFSPGDWVEVTDDWLEFSSQAGDMRQIDSVDDSSRTITLKSALTPNRFWVDAQNLTDPLRHMRIKRWDQSGIVRDSKGNTLLDLDAATPPPGFKPGLIPVQPIGTWVLLEDGVAVTFTTDPNVGDEFRPGDYWIFVARTADASVEKLDAKPPRGVHHHYGRLALVTFPSTVVDCRILWPPSLPSQGECCDCTVCVTAEQHNSDVFTIQNAVNQLLKPPTLKTGGGTICLGPGIFNLVDKPVQLSGASAIRIRGQGAATIIVQASDNAAFIINDSSSCTLDYLAIAMVPPSAPAPAGPTAVAAPAIRLSGTSSNTTIERVTVLFPIGKDIPSSVGILLETGTLASTRICDNVIGYAHFGIGFALDPNDAQSTVVLTDFYCERNFLFCLNTGIHLAGSCTYDHTVIAHNFIEIVAITDGAGIRATGTATGGLEVIANTIVPSSSVKAASEWDGIVVGTVGLTRICDNRIGVVNNGIRNGILFVKNPLLLELWLGPVVVSGNCLDELSETGIKVNDASIVSALIERNNLNAIGENGILMSVESRAANLKILGNELTNIGASDSTADIAGIYLNGVSEGAISDNCIQEVGTNSLDALSIYGLRVAHCEDMRISDNTITDIAPGWGSLKVSAAGILVAFGIANIEINDNLIQRGGIVPDVDTNPDPSQWQAVLIVSTEFGEPPVNGPGARQAGIHGNSLYGYGAAPLVEVNVSDACRFSDNHCSALGGLIQRAAVELTADSIIVSANRIECSTTPAPLAVFNTKPLALLLKGKSTTTLTSPRAYTVLGNITGGDIYVGNATLAASGSPLNVLNVPT